MAAISSNTESWSGHTHAEVETHIKSRFASIGGAGIQSDGTVEYVVALSESAYAALATKDSHTLYIVLADE
jgi:hypothetical protein